jgi:hypothetical protein
MPKANPRSSSVSSQDDQVCNEFPNPLKTLSSLQEDKRLKRSLKNRESALKSRKKKTDRLAFLEDENIRLKERIALLESPLYPTAAMSPPASSIGSPLLGTNEDSLFFPLLFCILPNHPFGFPHVSFRRHVFYL